jgi:hypothetical protein
MSPLEMCLAIVEAEAARREAEEDSLRAYRARGNMPLSPVSEENAGLARKAYADKVAADRSLRSLPIPTPEQLAKLRERVK